MPRYDVADEEPVVDFLVQREFDATDAIDEHDLRNIPNYENKHSRPSILENILASRQKRWAHLSKVLRNSKLQRWRRGRPLVLSVLGASILFVILCNFLLFYDEQALQNILHAINPFSNDDDGYCTTWPVDGAADVGNIAKPSQARLDLATIAPARGWEKPAGIRIVAIIFYGRKRTVDILDCYLQQNLAVNGGYLDEVLFLTHTDEDSDLIWLEDLVEDNPKVYRMVKGGVCPSKSFGCLWDHAVENKTMYIKIDDDMVYIHPDAIPQLVHTRINIPHPYAISANIINCPTLAMEHFHYGAIHPFVPESSHSPSFTAEVTWRPSEKPLFAGEVNIRQFSNLRRIPVPYHGHTWLLLSHDHSDLLKTAISKYDQHRGSDPIQFGAAWNSWGISAQQQYSLLHNIEENRMDRYFFGRNIEYPRGSSTANASAIIAPIKGGPGGEQTYDTGFDRFNVNFIALWGSDIRDQLPIAADDEEDISKTIPKRTGRPILVDTRSIVSHLSFYPQSSGIRKTDLLDRYRALANEAACPSMKLRVPFDQKCDGF